MAAVRSSGNAGGGEWGDGRGAAISQGLPAGIDGQPKMQPLAAPTAAKPNLRQLPGMPLKSSPFTPGTAGHLKHFGIVAGGGLLLLGVGAYFGVGAAYRTLFPSKQQAGK